MEARESAEAKEGIAAFNEKRPPNWVELGKLQAARGRPVIPSRADGEGPRSRRDTQANAREFDADRALREASPIGVYSDCEVPRRLRGSG